MEQIVMYLLVIEKTFLESNIRSLQLLLHAWNIQIDSPLIINVDTVHQGIDMKFVRNARLEYLRYMEQWETITELIDNIGIDIYAHQMEVEVERYAED